MTRAVRKQRETDEEWKGATFPGMPLSMVQSLKWAHAEAPCASALAQICSLPRASPRENSLCTIWRQGKKSLPRHLLFVALPPGGCDLQRASSLALSPILASAKTALLSPRQHHPAAVPVSCPSCHQPCAITPFYCVSIPGGDEVSFPHFHRSRQQLFSFSLPVSDTVSSLLISSLEECLVYTHLPSRPLASAVPLLWGKDGFLRKVKAQGSH